MSDRSKKVALTRVSVALLLALLLNANAHVFAHLGDAMHLLPAVGSSDDHGTSDTRSPFGDNDCPICQSLQHLRPSAAVTFAPLATHEEAIIAWRSPFFSTCNPAHAVSDRAPPLV